MPKTLQSFLPNEEATHLYGQELAGILLYPCVIYLHGELGAGKTTLVRSVLQHLGYMGRIKSPTYTLVETYELDKCTVYHFDLYRIEDGEALEFVGIRDYAHQQAITFIEWPEKGQGYLPQADLDISLVYDDTGRQIFVSSRTEHGLQMLSAMEAFSGV